MVVSFRHVVVIIVVFSGACVIMLPMLIQLKNHYYGSTLQHIRAAKGEGGVVVGGRNSSKSIGKSPATPTTPATTSMASAATATPTSKYLGGRLLSSNNITYFPSSFQKYTAPPGYPLCRIAGVDQLSQLRRGNYQDGKKRIQEKDEKSFFHNWKEIVNVEVINHTMQWHRIFPDRRTEARTEHERCHAILLRMLQIFTHAMEKIYEIGYLKSLRSKRDRNTQISELMEKRRQQNRKGSWFITHGTLLGAVRHGGIIPWDTDIDIAMTKSSILLLRRYWPLIFPRDMFLQTGKTDPGFRLGMATKNSIGYSRVKDRYSSNPFSSFNVWKGNLKMRYRPYHVGPQIDIAPLEVLKKGRSYRIFGNIIPREALFPIQNAGNFWNPRGGGDGCLNGIEVPLPHDPNLTLSILYGKEYMTPLPLEKVDASIIADRHLFCIATEGFKKSAWSLSWHEDHRGHRTTAEEQEKKKKEEEARRRGTDVKATKGKRADTTTERWKSFPRDDPVISVPPTKGAKH